MTIAVALNAARELAEQAVAQDTWMTAKFDRNDPLDWGEAANAFECGWESSTHFSCLYDAQLAELARQVARSEEVDSWVGVYEDLVREFWDTWETEAELGKAFEQHLIEHGQTENATN